MFPSLEVFQQTSDNDFLQEKNFLQRNSKNYVHFLGPLLYFDLKQLPHNISIVRITNAYYQASLDNGIETCVVKKNSTTQVIIKHIKNTRPKSTDVDKGTVSFTSLLTSTSRLSFHRSSMPIKSQHINIYSNKIFKTTLAVQALQQHLCDMLPLVNKWLSKTEERATNSS